MLETITVVGNRFFFFAELVPIDISDSDPNSNFLYSLLLNPESDTLQVPHIDSRVKSIALQKKKLQCQQNV